MSFPKYSSFADSGFEWLGAVPSHWEVQPIKWQTGKNDGGVWGFDPDGTNDTIVLRSTDQTVDGHWRMDDPALRALSPADRDAALLAEGDLVVTKSSGSSLHIGKTTIVTPEVAALGCCYSNFMQRIRMKASFQPKLAWYVMNNAVARLQFDLASNSTTGLANLNGTMIGRVLIPIPPVDEQVAIVTFLDHETAKIDALIEEQKRLIELLKEKRQAVISQAVTKGLDPTVPMKDSGVEWLGQVPAHWSVRPFKHCVSYQEGPGIMASDFRDEGVPLLRIACVQGPIVTLDGCNYLDPAKVARQWGHFCVAAGDLLISGSASMGVVSEVLEDAAGAIPYTGLIRLQGKANVVDRSFLRQLVVSDCFMRQVEQLKTGSTIQHFGPTHLDQMVITCPPVQEQVLIGESIVARCADIDALSEQARMGMELLQERRSALISAAVTGKIDVRGLAPQPDATPA